MVKVRCTLEVCCTLTTNNQNENRDMFLFAKTSE